MDKLRAFLEQGKSFWKTLTFAKRVALVLSTLGVLGAVYGITEASTRETYTYLFTELSPEDASAIVGKLKELKIPYKIDESGAAIEVPEDKVHELRLDLAGQGLPRGGGVGFEIFDKQHLGATELEQRVHLRRALEGELSRTISQLGAVQAARVHLVLPERSLFAAGAREPASASVVLHLRQGRTFGKPEIASVVHLVSSAVPGLAENHVSIVSADGTTLHRPESDTPGAQGDAREERERDLAMGLEEQARALLERTLGPGHADVRIRVELDASSRERTEEHYDPDKTALRSEQRMEEHAPGSVSPTVAGVPTAAGAASGAPPQGVPGSQSNLPNGSAGPEASAAASASPPWRQSWTRNWEVQRITEKTVLPSGRIARLTVAVLVDGSYKSGAYAPRDKAELDRMSDLVKGAIGFDTTRGDALNIESSEFAKTEVKEPAPEPEPLAAKWKKPVMWGPAAAAATLLSILIVTALRRKGKRAAAAVKKVEETPPVLPPDPQAAVALLEAARPPATVEERAKLHTEAVDIATKDPATAAVVLRTWLGAKTAN